MSLVQGVGLGVQDVKIKMGTGRNGSEKKVVVSILGESGGHTTSVNNGDS